MTLDTLIGSGTDLTVLQMTVRSIIVFILALGMLRIAGRRSFGVGTPFDHVVTILLGAILSKAVTGSSPFVPTLAASGCLVILHRALAWLVFRFPRMSRFIEGDKILLFSKGKFLNENHGKALVRKEDIYQGVRKAAQTENMDLIDKVYMERNGEVCAVKKAE